MRNPLHKRYPRQLVHDAGRYIGIFVLLVVTISVTSGFLATISSIQHVIAEQQASSSLEDARVETSAAIGKDVRQAVEDLGVTAYNNWSRDASSTIDGVEATIRTYCNRTSVDTPSYFAGRAPEASDEIALDDTFCSKHGLSVGDSLDLEGKHFTICGIMVLPDYNTLMRSNTDFVMDMQTFSVALVTEKGFTRLSGVSTTYTYSLIFDDKTLSVSDRIEQETKVTKKLEEHGTTVTSLLDREQNQGISYLATDMNGDSAVYLVLLYVLVAIMAFIFVVLVNATVVQESSVIGTLRASGWRKDEIIRHYLFLPCFVGLVTVVVGNVLGYTVVSGVARELYYGSYSIPPYHATFDAQTFLLTSVLPYTLLVAITFVGLARKLGETPLAFLRHEVSHGRRRHNLHLPAQLGYATRFRLRFLMRNTSTFVTLFIGVLASSFLVLYSLVLLPMFNDYADHVADSMPAKHIYVLKAPYELQMTDHQQKLRDQLGVLAGIDKFLPGADELGLSDMAESIAADIHPVAKKGTFSSEAIDQAEKACVASLQVSRKMGKGEEDVSAYGIQKNSRYWTGLDVSDGRVLVGQGLLDKCGMRVGDTVVLYDRFTDKSYAFVIDAATGDSANMNVYMSCGAFRDAFGYADDWFNAYVSNKELNIDSDYLSSDITPQDMQNLAGQMIDTFSDMVQLILVAAAVVFFVVMYLLTKTVLDHSARSISLMKVFGYRNREIRRLYLSTITLAVAISLVVGLPLAMWGVSTTMEMMMLSYPGNFVVTYTSQVIVEDLAIGFATYLVVALFHLRRIKRIPLALALKVQE